MTEQHAPDCLLELDEVNQLREQLETERRAFEASREVWKLEREHQEQQLLERASELHLLEREVEQQRHLLDCERQAWEQRTADLAPQMAGVATNHDASSRSEKDSASPMASSPSDTIDGTDYDPIATLEQLRSMVETEEEEDGPQDEAIRPIAPAHQPAAPTTRMVDNEEHEETIDDYMSKLMSRVNGKSERIGPEPITPVPSMAGSPALKATTPPSANEAGQPDLASVDDIPEPPDPQNPAPPRRRSARPDLSTHLATMREVANTSARSAIDTSARQKRNRAVVRNTAVMAGIFVIAGYMIFGLFNLLEITALLAVCVGVAALLRKYRDCVPIAYVIDWAKHQSLRWRKLTPQENATESNEPSDAAESITPISQNSTKEAADDNSRIDSH